MLELSEKTPILPGNADGRLKTLVRRTITEGPSRLDTDWAKTEFPDFPSYKAAYIAHEGLLHTLAMEGALFAPVIDIALSHRSERNPYGLIYAPTRSYAHSFLPTDPSTFQVLPSFKELRNNHGIHTNPFKVLYIASTDTLRAASDELVSAIEEQAQTDPTSLGSQTYDTYLDFRQPFDNHVKHKHKGIREDLHRGSETAAMVDAAILKAIPEVATKIYGLDPYETPDFKLFLKQVARNSEGFMTEVTQLDKRRVVWLQDTIFYPFLSRDHDNGLHYFCFSKSKDGKITLDFTADAKKELQALQEKYKHDPMLRYGCPLATAVDKPSSTDPTKIFRESGVSQFWQWMYRLGTGIYDDLYPQSA